MKLQALLALALLWIGTPIAAKDQYINNVRWIEIPVQDDRIVCQGKYEVGCGPASILNSLAFGSAADKRALELLPGRTSDGRIKYLLDTYGPKPSRENGQGKRLQKDGFDAGDLLDTCNEVRQARGLEPLTGSYLNRGTKESKQQLLLRIHKLLVQSLRKGEPPIISFYCQAAHWDAKIAELFWDKFGRFRVGS